jgi:cytochrome-b5 reductase
MERWGIEGGIPKKKKESAAPAAPAPKVFTGGDQGFVSLKLDNVETINHNTKKFRFAFEDPESVSGLVIACETDRGLRYRIDH